MLRHRRAKILATVGPASASPGMLRRLYLAGVDTFRLNFSHGDHDTHAATIATLRALEKDLGSPIGILQDLQGPKIRLGDLGGNPLPIQAGQKLTLVPMSKTDDAGRIPLPHPEIFAALKVGDRLFIDDGRVRLVVRSVNKDRIKAEVIVGQTLSDRKGVNLPDCMLDMPCLTQKDRKDLAFGLAHGVDWVALSFVQRASDIVEIANLVEGKAGIVAKIEKPSALTEIMEIAQISDAIMIARGDLGVEIPPEDVPGWQKEIISLCRRKATPVIVATQMLESMTDAAAPTRAEASDVATAIYDGADAVMLSAESASGRFPLETVEVMDRIICSTEDHALYPRAIAANRAPTVTDADAIADTGASLACTLNSKCIVAFSQSGATARRVSARRPALPLIVLTSEHRVSRQMSLVWGAHSILENGVADYDSMVRVARTNSADLLTTTSGSMVVLAGIPFGQTGSTNNIRVAHFSCTQETV